MLPLAVRTGLEPATPGVTGRYSNQLNYRTNLFSLMRFSQTRMQMYAFFLNLQIFLHFFSIFLQKKKAPIVADPRLQDICNRITARQLPDRQHPEDQADRPGKDPEHLAADLPVQPSPCPLMLHAMLPRVLHYTYQCQQGSEP